MENHWMAGISRSMKRARAKNVAAVAAAGTRAVAEIGVTAVEAVAGATAIEIFPMKAENEQHIEVEGRVQTVLAGTMFRVELPNKHVVLATISGKMRKRFVRITAGDRVKMEMSPYDLDKARIVWRVG